MDLVYLCRVGENEELRYSLRSAAANLPHDRVWIFGGAPEWVTGAQVVPTIQFGTRFANTTNAMKMACQSEAVSDPFILMNDDFFIMRPVDGVPVMNRGPVDNVIAHYRQKYGDGPKYLTGMMMTAELLKTLGHQDPLSYELHVPLVVHKAVMLEALTVGGHIPVLHKRTLYGNLRGVPGETIADVKVYDEGQEVPQGPWVSSHDPVFGAVQPVLRYLFWEPCRYEDPTGRNGDMPKKIDLPLEGIQVFSPNRQFTGTTAGIQFVNGNGVIPSGQDNTMHLLGWFKDHGYIIGEPLPEAPAEPQPDQEPPTAAEQAKPEQTPTPALFDPTDHNVAEVLAYLKDADEGEKARVGALEAAGKDRGTIIKAVGFAK